ncbi:MAG: prepilin peptidase [Anaeromyxobacteraceae bacterium]|nr:prepilin peptidase [Anaeromyxobacteraceae bacterium]
MPPALMGAYAAVLGATVGSFLNVVIARVPAGLSVVRPRSRCPRCERPIAWHDNLPVVSWLLLRGRCRGCALPISVRYPVVELLGGLLGWAAWHRHGFTAAALAELCFTAFLLALAAIDLDTWLLPNALTWPLIALGLGAAALGLSAAPSLGSAAWGAGLGFAAFFAVSWVGEKAMKKEALGFGDVWLLAGLGAWLGALALLPVVLLASTQGAVVGLALVALGKAQPGPEEAPGPAAASPPGQPSTASTPKPTGAPPADEVDDWVPPRNAVPFGPFLVAGALEWLWFAGPLARAIPLFEIFR